MKAIEIVFERVLSIPLPTRYLKALPKIRSAIQIFTKRGSYRTVEKELKEIYGVKGGYILGRLNGDEIEEFRYTNDIPGRIAMKKNLKWLIMQANLAKLQNYNNS